MEKVNVNLEFDSAKEAAEFFARASVDPLVQKKALLSSIIRHFSGEEFHSQVLLMKVVRAELNMSLCEAKEFVESLASFKR